MNRTIIIASASVVSTTVGSIAGYLYAKKRLKTQYADLANEEIESAKVFYGAMYKTGDLSTPTKAAEKLGVKPVDDSEEFASVNAGEALATYQGTPVAVVTSDKGLADMVDDGPATVDVEEPSEAELEEAKVGETLVEGRPINREDFDIEAERDKRKNGVPFVVSQEEFDENEFDFQQTVLTYFSYDKTLCDEDERQIDDVEQTVGVANLMKFGHGSNDPKVVYIRNERREVDYEVLQSDGSYAEEVLGLTEETELKHSDMPRRSRRVFDE